MNGSEVVAASGTRDLASPEEVDQRLHSIMKNTHAACVKYGAEGKSVNYLNGANIAGFVKVADAMLAQGVY